MTSIEHRQQPRAPVTLEVRIQYPHLDQLVHECSSNMSLGGMFVRTIDPPPVGTSFRFAIDVADEVTMVAGEAEVVWTQTDDDPRHPAGMGVRFTRMDEITRRIIFQLVDRHIQTRQGEPFDLGRPPS